MADGLDAGTDAGVTPTPEGRWLTGPMPGYRCAVAPTPEGRWLTGPMPQPERDAASRRRTKGARARGRSLRSVVPSRRRRRRAFASFASACRSRRHPRSQARSGGLSAPGATLSTLRARSPPSLTGRLAGGLRASRFGSGRGSDPSALRPAGSLRSHSLRSSLRARRASSGLTVAQSRRARSPSQAPRARSRSGGPERPSSSRE